MCKNESKSLPVAGYEAQVTELRGKLAFYKQLSAEVALAKDTFRLLAKQAAVDGVSSLDFQDGVGGSIAVALPDVAKAGNRLSLSSAKLTQAIELGIDLTDRIETEEVYTLTGGWVDWLKEVLDGWKKNKVDTSAIDGLCALKETTKLSPEGTMWLRELAAAGGEGADTFLGIAIKAANVTSKG